MKIKQKNIFLFMLYALCLGAIIGFIVWLFMKIMNISISFLWTVLPEKIDFPFYTIIVCLIGGLIIGLWQKKVGDYPEDLETVISKVKKEGKYSYKNIKDVSIAAILPLIFGGSVGPEAGLSGIIVGLCSWISDKFKYMFKELKELTQIGISATLGTIFNSPMFGFMEPIESEEGVTLPKRAKIVLYFLAIFGAFGMMIFLKNIFGSSAGLISFSSFKVGINEWIWLIPLSLIGVLFGLIYCAFEKFVKKITKPLEKYNILKCIICGLILGIFGTLLPFVMFSGEEQMHEVIANFSSIGVVVLFFTALVKLFMTNICINLGFKGGHFFPCIFSGICLGYVMSFITLIDPVFCVCVVTTSLMAFLMKKPLATVFLLMICFPASALVIMLFASVIGSVVKIPRFLLN